MRPPNGPVAAAVVSTWMGCGSNVSAKSMICVSVSVIPGDRNSSPTLKSSRNMSTSSRGRRLRGDVDLRADARGVDPRLPRLALLLREDLAAHLLLVGGEGARLGRRALEDFHHVEALRRLDGLGHAADRRLEGLQHRVAGQLLRGLREREARRLAGGRARLLRGR